MTAIALAWSVVRLCQGQSSPSFVTKRKIFVNYLSAFFGAILLAGCQQVDRECPFLCPEDVRVQHHMKLSKMPRNQHRLNCHFQTHNGCIDIVYGFHVPRDAALKHCLKEKDKHK